jgi:glycosyltransferase involved in cell wall biosynthesis
MPEVAGAEALMVDPHEPEKIADALLKLETENVLYQKQVNYGLMRAQQFSWENTANELVQLYRSLQL